MTPEKLKEIEQRYLANGDALDASSYCVLDLIHEVRALRIDNSRANQWSDSICHVNDLLLESQKRISERIKELEATVATLQAYVDDVEWFNAALADKDWPIYSIEFIDSKPVGVNMMQFKSEDACGDTLIEAIRAARKGEPK